MLNQGDFLKVKKFTVIQDQTSPENGVIDALSEKFEVEEYDREDDILVIVGKKKSNDKK